MFLYLVSVVTGLYKEVISDIFMTQLSASVKQTLRNHLPVVKGNAIGSRGTCNSTSDFPHPTPLCPVVVVVGYLVVGSRLFD